RLDVVARRDPRIERGIDEGLAGNEPVGRGPRPADLTRLLAQLETRTVLHPLRLIRQEQSVPLGDVLGFAAKSAARGGKRAHRSPAASSIRLRVSAVSPPFDFTPSSAALAAARFSSHSAALRSASA